MTEVLVVDDDSEVRELIKYTLEDFEVRFATNGTEAMNEVTKQAPDIVVLDVMMPGISGLRVLEIWREDPDTRDIPVILLTAKTQEADIDKGFAIGADDYVVKPFSPIEMARRIEAVLARARRR